jgi:hypothetical protein
VPGSVQDSVKSLLTEFVYDLLGCFPCDVIAGMMAPEKSWCLVESPAHWKPQEEGVMNTAARFSLN